jgi:hypothetical protein
LADSTASFAFASALPSRGYVAVTSGTSRAGQSGQSAVNCLQLHLEEIGQCLGRRPASCYGTPGDQFFQRRAGQFRLGIDLAERPGDSQAQRFIRTIQQLDQVGCQVASHCRCAARRAANGDAHFTKHGYGRQFAFCAPLVENGTNCFPKTSDQGIPDWSVNGHHALLGVVRAPLLECQRLPQIGDGPQVRGALFQVRLPKLDFVPVPGIKNRQAQRFA